MNRDKQRNGAAHASRSRARRAERAASRGMLAGALALGLVSGGGVAFAFWKVSDTATVPTVNSGMIDLLADGVWYANSGSENFDPGGLGATQTAVNANGVSGTYTLSGLDVSRGSLAGMFPGDMAATIVTGSNSVGSNAPIIVTTGSFQVLVGGQDVSQYFSFSMFYEGGSGNTSVAVDNPGPTESCAGGKLLVSTDAAAQTYENPIVLLPGDQQRYCIQIGMDADAPDWQGETMSVTVTLNGDQQLSKTTTLKLFGQDNAGTAAAAEEFDLSGMVPYLNGIPTDGLYPAGTAATMITLTNATASDSLLQMSDGTAIFVGAASIYLTAQLKWGGTVANGTCVGGSTTVPTVTLHSGESTTVCVQVTVAGDMPQSAKGQTATISLAFTAKQASGG